jgi:hypothetical protein
MTGHISLQIRAGKKKSISLMSFVRRLAFAVGLVFDERG